MEAFARAPDPLTLSEDMANTWRIWKVEFFAFMNLAGFNDHPNDVKVNFLKNRIGKIGLDVIEDMTFEQPNDKDDMDILIEKLDAYFDPPKKEIVERNRFFSRFKRNNESIEEYVSSLQKLAKDCNFEHLTDSIIRDKVILEIKDYEVRKKIFNKNFVNLSTLISIYNDYEVNTKKWRQGPTENLHESENTGRIKKPHINKGKTCWRCGVSHPMNSCPAWGKQCAKCNTYNHFTGCCRMAENKGNDQNKDKRNENNNTSEKVTNISTEYNTNRMVNATNPIYSTLNSTLPKVPITILPSEQTPSTSNQPKNQPVNQPRPTYTPTTAHNNSTRRQPNQTTVLRRATKTKEAECVLS